MTIPIVESLARQLLLAKGDTETLGKNWYYTFLSRHKNLKTTRTRTLDQARRDAEDPEVLQAWFSLFTATVQKYGIAPDDWYNMDEKGLMKGVGDNAKVIISRDEKD